MSISNEELFSDKNKAKSLFVKWGKQGDWFKGTLLGIREVANTFPGKEGTMNKIYDFRAHGGEFHETDENKIPVDPAITVNDGDFYSIGGKAGIDNSMRNAKVGQIVGMKFTETKAAKTKGFAPLKIIAVYNGGMDPDYAGESMGDVTEQPF